MKQHRHTLLTAAVLMAAVISCSKNSNTSSRQVINNLSGIWHTKSISCYRDTAQPYFLSIPPDSYIKFNTDLTGQTYSGAPVMVYTSFGYEVLGDDSTLVFFNPAVAGGTAIPDTCIITKLTSSQLIYHGANKTAHGTIIYLCLNPLDSLYR